MAWQTWMNRSSRSLVVEIVLVAVVGDLDAPHQFHDEVGPARLRRARIEHLGDVRMIHHRQRLPLGLEPGDDLLGVHAQLDDLERHAAAHRFGLLGHIDHAAAAFAHALQQFVAPNRLAHRFILRFNPTVNRHRGNVRLGQLGGGQIMRGQQGIKPLAQGGFAVAGPVKEHSPFLARVVPVPRRRALVPVVVGR